MIHTADVSSLYTNIPTKKGLELVEQFLNEYQSISSTDYARIDETINLLRSVLNYNIFTFLGKTYQQINGTAMGTVVAPTYANIFMFMLERNLVNHLAKEKILLYYGRYLDDIILITRKLTTTETHKTHNTFNQLHPSIKFNWLVSDKQCEFLDLLIFKGKRFNNTNIFDLKVHQKILNNYLYIPYSSFNPIYQKIGTIKTELIRYIRICSSIEYYTEIKRKFFQRLKDRGYPTSFLKKYYNIVQYKDRQKYLEKSIKKTKDLTPLVLDYTSFNINNRKRITDSLHNNTKLKAFYNKHNITPPTIVWRSASKLSKKLCSNKRL